MRIQYVRTNESEDKGWKTKKKKEKTRVHYIYKIIEELSLCFKRSSFRIHLEVDLVYSALDDKKIKMFFFPR